MQISVIGAAGFIGSALVARLRQLGLDPHTPDRAQIAAGPPPHGWGTLVWAAGLTADFRQRPHATVAAHVGDLNTVLQQGTIGRLVYLSSTRVYQRGHDTTESAAIPCLPTDPSDLYNISKIMGESLSLSCGLAQVAIARLSNIVGPGEMARDTFLGAICREARQGAIRLQSAEHSAKDYLWIDDAVDVLAGMTLDDRCGIVNVAAGRQITHRQWADALCATTGAGFSVLANAAETSFPAIATQRMRDFYGAPAVDPLDRVSHILAQP